MLKYIIMLKDITLQKSVMSDAAYTGAAPAYSDLTLFWAAGQVAGGKIRNNMLQ